MAAKQIKLDTLLISQPQEIDPSDRVAPPRVPVKNEKSSGEMSAALLPPSAEVAASHSILFLTESTFRNTKVSGLMLPYGGADGGGSCDNDFGNDLVTRWRGGRTEVCSSSSSSSSNSAMSSINCYPIKQTRHAGVCDNLCVMHGVSLDISVFADDQMTYRAVENYVSTKHMAQPYIKPPRGTIAASCNVRSEHWDPKYYPGWNADWVTGAVDAGAYSASAICDETWHEKALLIQRDTFANFFHDSEDFVNTFLSLAILEWSLNDTQLLVTDLHPNGPFW